MATLTNAKAFKGILQYKSTDNFTKEAGYVYFIREFNENGEETGNAEIYFGNRKYGDVNVSQLSEIENILETKLDSNNLKTINNESLVGDGNIVVGNIISEEDDSLSVDDVDTNTYVKYVAQTLTEKQKAQARTNINALSENNIKTINGESIVGSGNITISGGSGSIDTSNYYTKTEIDNKGFVEGDELSIVAKSGSYNDLSNKPTIPSAVTESTVSGWGFTKNTGTYSKPSAGIPKTDLSSAVQTSLGKADTALQSYTEQYKGTVTGVKINGTTKNPSNGVVDLGTVITTHQTLKTINGESIVGSGDIVISGGGSSSGNSAYSEVSHGTADTTFTLTPNTFHIWNEVSFLALTLGAETSGVANEYLFQFTSGSEPTTLSLPDDIKWTGGETPTIEANKIYQISILKGLGCVLSWDTQVLIDNLCTYDWNRTVTFQYPVASNVSVYIGNTIDMSIEVPVSIGETTATFSVSADPGSNIVAISPTQDDTYNYIF